MLIFPNFLKQIPVDLLDAELYGAGSNNGQCFQVYFIELSSSVWFKTENKVSWNNFLKITVQLNDVHRSLFFLMISHESAVKNKMLNRICLVMIK